MKFSILKLFLSFFLFAFMANVSAQQVIRCYTKEYTDFLKSQDPDLGKHLQEAENVNQQWRLSHPSSPNDVQAIVTIPVVVHIVYRNSSDSLLMSRVTSQIDVLNADFSRTNADASNTPAVWQSIAANCNVQFCLAKRRWDGMPTNGVTYTKTTINVFTSDDKVKKTALGGIDPWDRNKFLNIWVCNLGTSLLGYSSPVGGSSTTDGVVIRYTTFGNPGTESGYAQGRTCTHEVGHWLGLRHIWGDDAGDCSSGGGTDFISDTPDQTNNTWGCHTFPFMDSCSSVSPGIMFMNYMDYSDDVCLNMFTNGQKTVITSVINGARAAIKTSNGCLATVAGMPESDLLDKDISVYPNPAQAKITVQSEFQNIAGIKVLNILGEKIFDSQFPFPVTSSELDLSLFNNGIYFLEIHSPGSFITKKIILN